MGKFKPFEGLAGYHGKRQVALVLLTLLAWVVPFVKIGGNHLFLLSFTHKRFEFLGFRYEAQELFLIPILLLLVVLLVFFMTSLGGRVFCGWVCPQTLFRMIYRDWILFRLLRLGKVADKNRPIKTRRLSVRLRYALAMGLWVVLAFLAAANFLWYFHPPEEFAAALAQPGEHQFLMGLWVGLAAFLVAAVLWWKEGFCLGACPYARIQSVFFDEKTPVILYDHKRGDHPDGSRGKSKDPAQTGDCTDCLACVKACPTGIDIRDGLQQGCVACLDCVDACKPQMAKKGKPGLIHWTTEAVLAGEKMQWLRGRTLFYLVLLVTAVGILAYRSLEQAPLLLNVNRTSELYTLRKGQAENHLSLLVTNKTAQGARFKVVVVSPPELNVIRPKGDFFIEPGGQVRKTLVVRLPGPAPQGEGTLSRPLVLKVQGPGDLAAQTETVFIQPGD